MKITFQSSKKNKDKDICCWLPWFAWYPITIYSNENPTTTVVWLETVFRKRGLVDFDGNGGGYIDWVYKLN